MHKARWNIFASTGTRFYVTVFYVFFRWFTLLSGQLTPDERAKFQQFNLWPGVTLVSPLNVMKVSYNYKNVKLGNYFQMYEVSDAPVFLQWPREMGAYYILFLLGPDVPSIERPHWKHCQHWVIANIPGNRIEEGDVLVDYAGLTHHYLAGVHRMVFVVFKQRYNFTMEFELPRLEKGVVGKERFNFSIQNFVDKYYLDRPVASNFLRVLSR